MILRFKSDNSINGRGFVLNYTSFSSTGPPPTCGSGVGGGNGTALLTAVIETRSSASGVSWALTQVRVGPLRKDNQHCYGLVLIW